MCHATSEGAASLLEFMDLQILLLRTPRRPHRSSVAVMPLWRSRLICSHDVVWSDTSEAICTDGNRLDGTLVNEVLSYGDVNAVPSTQLGWSVGKA